MGENLFVERLENGKLFRYAIRLNINFKNKPLGMDVKNGANINKEVFQSNF